MDPVRALVIARLDQLGMTLAEASKRVGKSHSYLQQFIRRGIPATLPEDVRERLAPLLSIPAEVLRGAVPSKGAPKPAAPDAVAVTEDEATVLRTFRSLSPEAQRRALLILPTLD